MFKFTIILLSLTLFIISCSGNNDKTDVPNEYKNADGYIGGILYDTFYAMEARFDQLDPYISHYREFSDFYRCKSCHGWDLQGSNGAYIDKEPTLSSPRVNNLNLYEYAQSKTPQELFDAIKFGGEDVARRHPGIDLTTYNPDTNYIDGDLMPDFSQILSDEQIWQLVKFLKEHSTDVSELYDAQFEGEYPNGSIVLSNIGKGGNAERGFEYYKKTCGLAPCHGVDGTARITHDGYTLGQVARLEPDEFQHKVKFGNPGTNPPMPGDRNIDLQTLKDLLNALLDEEKFPLEKIEK